MNSVNGNEKQQVEASQNKSIDSNILEKIVIVPKKNSNSNKNQEEPEKIIKQNQNFSLSKELEKIKIQVPLLELAKTPGYKKEITEFINLSQSDDIGDTVNLQEEKPVVTFGPHLEEVDY